MGKFINNLYIKNSFFVLFGVASFMLFASCNRPNIDNMNANEKKELSSAVYLHRTSAKAITITDKDGVGLVYGNVTRIGFKDKKREKIIVEYKPFDINANNVAKDNSLELKVSEIDLITAKVTPILDSDEDIVGSLKDVKTMF